MFRQFLPSEFDAHGIAYSRQLKDALIINNWRNSRGLKLLLDEHFQRWLNCDVKDVRIAINILKKHQQTPECQVAMGTAEHVVDVYKHRRRWLILQKIEIPHFEIEHNKTVDAMNEFQKYAMRPETLFLAYRLHNVFTELCPANAIQMSISLSLLMEQPDYRNIPSINKKCYQRFLQTKQLALLSTPTIYTFLDILMHVVDIPEMLVLYFAELAVVSKAVASYHPSDVAAACVFLSNVSLDREFWPYVLENFAQILHAQVSNIAAVIFNKAKQVMGNVAFRDKYNRVGRTVMSFGIKHFQQVIIRHIPKFPLNLRTAQPFNIDVQRQIAKGAYGIVFIGKYQRRACAIKTMSDKLTFNREVSLLLAAKSNHIIGVVDYMFKKIQNNRLCIVLNRGKDFYEQLKRADQPSKNTWSIQLMRAVQHCHNCGIMHRDIKPENIVIVKNQLKLCDFGMARRVYLSPRSYTIPVSTIHWRAPEILLGKRNYNEKIDVWSTGIVLCQCILLQSIFQFDGGGSDWGQMMKIWQLFGTPTEDTWSGVSILPEFNNAFPHWPENGVLYQSVFRDVLSMEKKKKKDAIRGMLQLNPERRMTMTEALHCFAS